MMLTKDTSRQEINLKNVVKLLIISRNTIRSKKSFSFKLKKK